MKTEELVNSIVAILNAQGVYKKMLVPFIWGPSGIGKSDLMEQISEKMGLKFIDIRLTHYDESVVAGFPYIKDSNYGQYKSMGTALPDLIDDSLQVPSLIMFDEINRANQNIRNPMLQVICERRLGKIQIPEHTKMVACGNLGEDDNNDVETLDSAHLNRFAHFKWEPTTEDWIRWAESQDKNPLIVNFYKYRKALLLEKGATGETKSFSTPRTVAALCDIVDSQLDKNQRRNPVLVKKIVDDMGFAFIGSSYRNISLYLEEMANFGADQIVKNYKEVRQKVLKMEAHKHSEFISEIKFSFDFFKIDREEAENICDFINDIREDEATGYAYSILTKLKNNQEFDNPNISIMKKKCKKYFQILSEAEKATA